MGQQAFQFAGKQVFAEPARHAIGEARRCAGFIGAEDPAEAFFAEIIRLVGLAQDGELATAGCTVGLQLR